MDLISVIVPVYKVETYLNECIQSIVEQSYKDLQIILIDDGSPDNCPRMCEEWKNRDSRIEVIHKGNGGLSDARNKGLGKVQGKFLCFVDSDDIIGRYYIEAMYKAAVDNQVDLVGCDIQCFWDGEITGSDKSPTLFDVQICSSEEALEDVIHGRGFRAVVWNKLFKTTLLQGENFKTGYYHEDEFFTYRILDKAGKMAYVNAVLYYYRQRPNSIMTSFSEKHIDVLEAYLERLEFLEWKYPRLYKIDKLSFCRSCVYYYCMALKYKSKNIKQIKKRISIYRKKVRFSFSELKEISLVNLPYVLASQYAIGVLCNLLNIREGIKNGKVNDKGERKN